MTLTWVNPKAQSQHPITSPPWRVAQPRLSSGFVCLQLFTCRKQASRFWLIPCPNIILSSKCILKAINYKGETGHDDNSLTSHKRYQRKKFNLDTSLHLVSRNGKSYLLNKAAKEQGNKDHAAGAYRSILFLTTHSLKMSQL